MNKIIDIENRLIGKDQPCFIIGEIGSNHNRDKKTVMQLIDACAEAGFDAVKFQIYDAEEAFSKNEMTTDVKLDHLYGGVPGRIHPSMPQSSPATKQRDYRSEPGGNRTIR